jgi:hypothetical protein
MFDRRERLDALVNELDSAVESGLGEEAFLVQLARAAGLSPEELEAAREELAALYRQLHVSKEPVQDIGDPAPAFSSFSDLSALIYADCGSRKKECQEKK